MGLLVAYVAPVVFIVVFASALLHTYRLHLRLRKAVRDGTAQLIEGYVTHFSPMPYEGHADESFVINGNTLAYSDFNVTGCFNNTSSHGGPIREGLRIRIWVVNDCIARLEVADEPVRARR
jgi:hypothetical protein